MIKVRSLCKAGSLNGGLCLGSPPVECPAHPPALHASMTTLLDHKTTLAYLAYLGYPDEQRTSALLTTRPRKLDRRKGKVSRNVFLCYVCGAAGSGKTSLLRSFAGKPFREAYEPTSKMVSVVNAVDIDGSEKYLVVRSPQHLARG